MVIINNIWMDVASAFILAVLIVIIQIQYVDVGISNIYFKQLTISAFVMTLIDIIACITLSIPTIPRIVNVVDNSLYYIAEVVSIWIFCNYVRSYYKQDRGSLLWRIFSMIPLMVYVVAVVVNLFVPIIFEVGPNNEFTYGNLHLLVYLIPLYYLLCSVGILIVKKSFYTRKQFAATITFTLAMLVTMLMQSFICPNLMLCCFGVTLSLLIMLTTLETPDYRRLMATMKELEDAKDAAMAASKAKSTFLASMSHEIRTPINGVLGMNEIILKSNPSDDIRECSENIESSGKSLLAIINDILDLSKIESGKMELGVSPYDPMELVNEVNMMMGFRAEEKNLSYTVEVSPNLPSMLSGDEVRVRQIIVNLVSNAIKYTAKGFVKWSLEGRPSDKEGTIDMVITVSDSGQGIKPDALDTIFDAFERVDETKNHKIEGTGLGLKITKQFVELMQGDISIVSEVDVGSTFTVVLPQVVADATCIRDKSRNVDIRKAEVEEEIPDFSAYRILAVDDTAVNLKVVAGLLKKTNISVDTAISGRIALDYMAQTKYDVILLDHLMPDIDGVETLKLAQEMPDNKNRETPIIVLTANAIEGAKEEYLKAGFTDYLSKPVNGKSLVNILKKFLFC